MKRIVAILLTLVLTLSLSGAAFAQVTEPKGADVTLVITQIVNVDALNVGQNIPLEVSAIKKGSACTAIWSVTGLNTDGTTFDVADENYSVTGDQVAAVVTRPVDEMSLELENYWVASGSFTGLAAGTYQITAELTMTAGKSHVSWTGSDSTNVTVVNPITVTGFTAKNFVATEVWNKPHTSITGYDVTYDLYIQYSDNTEKLYQSLKEAMGAGQKVDVLTITYEGTEYTYNVINPLKQ